MVQPVDSMTLEARRAARELAGLDSSIKNRLLLDLADLIDRRRDAILAANRKDMEAARSDRLTEAKLRRLEITDAVAAQMSDGLRLIAVLPDPVGKVVKEYDTDSGLRVRKVRIPLGVILMIYESRPNVTIDAFGLCFKASNACVLKGGREASHSNAALLGLVREALSTHRLPTGSVGLITTSDRDEIRELLTRSEDIDLVIPRGGRALIDFVCTHSRIPTVQHFQGVCHIYVDEHADLTKALDICVTAKTSAPATCNAAECILIHRKIAESFVPQLVQRFLSAGVEVRGDEQVCTLSKGAVTAGADDWGREFLDMIVAMKVVPDIDAAIEHIESFGSNHTDVIISEHEAARQAFIRGVDSSCVLTNASTRFNDGFQLGLGAEIGISTSKIHAYGPMGLEELTTQRYVVEGTGQTR